MTETTINLILATTLASSIMLGGLTCWVLRRVQRRHQRDHHPEHIRLAGGWLSDVEGDREAG